MKSGNMKIDEYYLIREKSYYHPSCPETALVQVQAKGEFTFRGLVIYSNIDDIHEIHESKESMFIFPYFSDERYELSRMTYEEVVAYILEN